MDFKFIRIIQDGIPGRIRLFAINKIFTIEEFYEPEIWKAYTEIMKEAIAKDFFEWVQTNTEFKDQVSIHEANQNLLLQKYIKKGKTNIQEKKNILPDEPVTIKRNERGNA